LALQKIIIQVGDNVDLSSTIDQLETIGKVDKDNADQFKKSNDAAKRLAEETKKANEAAKKATEDNNKAAKEQGGIINNLRSNIQKLTELRDKSNNPKLLEQYNKKLDDANARLKTLTSTQKESVKQVGLYEKALANIGPALAGAFAVSNLISFGQKVIETTAKFQKFEAVLTNTLGSNSEAQKSIKMITKLAAETPFGVDELVGSYVKLVNQGFKPTEKEIVKLGDLAASQGKSFDMLSEAIIDAQTGEFERLKEFGIRASKEGDKVKFTFKGVQTQTDFTADSIRKYILSLGDLKGVSGGMAAISKTLGGQISNLGDSFDSLLLTIGTKLQGALSAGIGALSSAITTIKDLIADTAQESSIFSGVMDVVKFAINNLLAPLKELFNVLADTFNTVFKPIGNFLSAVFVPIIESFQKAFGGAGSSVSEFIAKFNPLIIALRVALLPLQLLAKGLERLTPIISDFIVPAFQDFTIFLAKARNEVADFVNAIIDSGFAKKVTSTFGFEIAKVGKVNIDELKKSFTATAEETEKSTKAVDENVKAVKKLTEYEKALAEEREKIRKKEIEDRVKSQIAFEKMQKDGGVADLNIQPKLEIQSETDKQSNLHKIRVEGMKKFQKEVLEPTIKASEDAAKKQDELELARIASRQKANDIYVDTAFQSAGMIFDAFEQAENRKAELAISAVEEQANKDIAAIDARLARGKISEETAARQKDKILKKAAQDEAAIKTKTAKNDKKFALLNIGLNAAMAVVKGIAMFGPPPSPAGIAAIAAAGITAAIQTAIVLATPIPKFKDGVIGLDGPGTGTSDSILARLSKGESVMTAQETRDYRGELEAMRKGTYEKYRMPITRRQSLSEARHEGMANSIYHSMQQQRGWDDNRLVGAIKDTKRSSKADEKLAGMIASKIGSRISENRIME
jgi:ABC-type transporter Mla subunit MlaD